MQNNIIWEGYGYKSLENCSIQTNEDGYEVVSTISISLEECICNLEYRIQIDKSWKSQYCRITLCEEEGARSLELQRLPGNSWLVNGIPDSRLDGYDAIDISTTPFPNTLIINRKKLEKEESFEVKMIYIDAMKLECERIDVRYTRLTEREYEYENLSSGFNVVLDVDEEGFVEKYPGHFKKV